MEEEEEWVEWVEWRLGCCSRQPDLLREKSLQRAVTSYAINDLSG